MSPSHIVASATTFLNVNWFTIFIDPFIFPLKQEWIASLSFGTQLSNFFKRNFTMVGKKTWAINWMRSDGKNIGGTQ